MPPTPRIKTIQGQKIAVAVVMIVLFVASMAVACGLMLTRAPREIVVNGLVLTVASTWERAPTQVEDRYRNGSGLKQLEVYADGHHSGRYLLLVHTATTAEPKEMLGRAHKALILDQLGSREQLVGLDTDHKEYPAPLYAMFYSARSGDPNRKARREHIMVVATPNNGREYWIFYLFDDATAPEESELLRRDLINTMTSMLRSAHFAQ
jgi:hypothetical protein